MEDHKYLASVGLKRYNNNGTVQCFESYGSIIFVRAMERMNNRTKMRINLGSFDLIKGSAMILVIVAHLLKTDHFRTEEMNLMKPLFAILRSSGFIMPMFFILSGYGFRRKAIGSMFKRTCKDMIIPYLWVMTGIAISYPLAYFTAYGKWNIALNSTICYVLAYFFGIPEYGTVIWGYSVAWISAVWYLLALFHAFNIMNLILYIRNMFFQCLCVSVCVLLGYILCLHEYNYFCMAQGLMAVGFCYLGYICKVKCMLVRGTESIWPMLILLPIGLLHMVYGHFDLAVGEFRYGILDYLGSGSMAMLTIIAGLYIEKLEWKLLDGIRQIGMYTYWILCIHSVEAGFPQWSVLVDQFGRHQYLAFFVECALRGLLIALVCILLKKRTKYRANQRRIKSYVIK